LIVNRVTTGVGAVAAVAAMAVIIGTFIWQYRVLNPAVEGGETVAAETEAGAGNLAGTIADGNGEVGVATTPVRPSPAAAESVTPTDTPPATEAPPTAVMPFNAQTIGPGEQKAYSFQASSGEDIIFWLHLPEEYDESQAWPLILSLHGFLGFEPSLEKVLEQSPLGYVRPDVEFPFIIIAPQAPDGAWAIYHEPIEELIAFLGESISIDPDAQFLTGLSAGAVGAWQWALAFPDRFAGMAINSGTPSLNPNDPVPEDICLLKDLPIWIAYSDADQHVRPMEPNRQVIMALEACGSTVVSLTVYSDLSHAEAISTAYEGSELYEWMLALME
jgi:predicted peptidase